MIRYLRITNAHDFIPAFPPTFLWRLSKHVGINIRLYDKKIEMRHSSVRNWSSTFKNNILKSPFGLWEKHRLPFHEKLMVKNDKELKQKTIDDLYNDKAIMHADFVRRDEFKDGD